MSNIVSEATNFQVAHLQEINEKFQKELSRVKEENRKLKHIIAYGNISTLSTLVDQYMEYSRVHLKKIAMEIQLSDYEEESTVEVLSLIEHLDYVKMELHKLIAVGEEGLVVHNENLKADVRLARELIPELESIIQLHVDAEQSEELKVILTDFAKKFKKSPIIGKIFIFDNKKSLRYNYVIH